MDGNQPDSPADKPGFDEAIAAQRDALRVLIVEDDRVTLRDLSQIVAELGHEVVAAVSRSAEALYATKLHEPDLVLMDIRIEGERDGISTAKLVREECECAVVFASSLADRDTLERAAKIKPNGYLVKPFRTVDIAAAISAAMANYVDMHRNVDLAGLAETAQVEGLEAGTMETLQSFIERKLDQAISTAELANLAGLSCSAFHRRFRQEAGITPYQFVVEKRLSEGKRLLRHTDMSIAEIALAVGYTNQSHFTSGFSKRFGIAPGKYRNL